jgi:hypothetical protein
MSKRGRLPVIFISDELAERTSELLDSFAQFRPSEGIVYWFGLQLGDRAVVTTLVVPDADTSGGAVSTTVEANAEAITLLVDTPLVHLGQAHSHPGRNVGHSSIDDAETFSRCDGAISVVVPWFGRYGFKLEECGVHRHMGGRFRRVEDVEDHLRIFRGFADLRRQARGEGQNVHE